MVSFAGAEVEDVVSSELGSRREWDWEILEVAG